MYRLVIESNGASKTVRVRHGETTVGASTENDLYFTAPGLSRFHASFLFDQGELTIRDNGSKNGTRVNGHVVTTSRLEPGDVVELAALKLRVERVESDDNNLAFRLSESGETPHMAIEADPGLGSWSVRKREELPHWTAAANHIAGILLAPGEPDLGIVLERLAETLDADGAAILEFHDGQPPAIIKVSPGSMSLAALDVVRPLCQRVEQGQLAKGAFGSEIVSDEPAVTAAVAASADRPTRCLAVLGRYPHRRASLPLLELTLRLSLHSEPEHIALSTPRHQSSPVRLHFPEGFVVGRSEAMQEVLRQVEILVRGDIPVLISGETGVGKELIARTLHLSSPRSRGPFEAVQCAAIPAELLEAELFGIEKGVATGVDARPGKFQLADGGVILLDEIGDMPLPLQAKMLRVLQSMEVHPVGGKHPVKVDVRIVAATNVPSETLLSTRSFRRDLYYRVAAYTLDVPPLRKRREDIPDLVEHFLRRTSAETSKRIRGISVAALRTLRRAPWPGNVRQLEHEVRRLAYLCPDGETIDLTLLPPTIANTASKPSEPIEDDDLTLEHHVARIEARLIRQALKEANGNRSKAAKLLGISRNGLAMKIARLRVGKAIDGSSS